MTFALRKPRRAAVLAMLPATAVPTYAREIHNAVRNGASGTRETLGPDPTAG